MSPRPRIALDVDVVRGPAFLGLPSDPARVGWIAALCEARQLEVPGQFDGERQLRAMNWHYRSFVKAWLAGGLLEHGDQLCDECRETYPGATSESLVVHRWRDHAGAAALRRIVRDGPVEADYEADIFGALRDRVADAWRQFPMDGRRADIVLRLHGIPETWVVIELKRERAGQTAIGQLTWYADWLAEHTGASVRAVLIAPDMRAVLPPLLEFLPLGADPTALLS